MDHATADAQPVVSRMDNRRARNLFELEQTMQMALTRIETLSRQMNDLNITSGKTHRDVGLTDDSVTEMTRSLLAFQKQMDQRWETQGIIQQKLNTTVAGLYDGVRAVQLNQISLQTSMDARWTTVDRLLSKLDVTLRENTAALQEASRADLECLVCMDKERNTVILPCSHFAVCGECLAQCRNCPVCRGPVDGSIKVYSA